MNSRLRVFGNENDMNEYRLPASGFNFPIQFLQMDASGDLPERILAWATQKNQIVYITGEKVWLYLPGGREQVSLKQLSEEFPEIVLPDLILKENQKIIH